MSVRLFIHKLRRANAAAELDAIFPAILPSSPGYDGTGDHALKGEL